MIPAMMEKRKINQFVLKVVKNMLKIGLRKIISLVKFRLMKWFFKRTTGEMLGNDIEPMRKHQIYIVVNDKVGEEDTVIEYEKIVWFLMVMFGWLKREDEKKSISHYQLNRASH
jgi:hypothetical protein